MPVEPNPFDRPDLLEISGEEDPLIAYVVVRESLGMSAGKISSQTGHGVMMLMGRYFGLLKRFSDTRTPLQGPDAEKYLSTSKWLGTSYRKVTLGADEKEWERLKTELDVHLVRDAGATEVEKGSETVIVLWPMLKSARPKFLKRMRALS